MSDLISREKIKKEAESLRVTVMGLRSEKGILAEYTKHYRESFLRMIEEQPSVEPVRGEWINDFKPPFFGNKCSVCGYPSGSTSFNFCPYCGSDMRGKKND